MKGMKPSAKAVMEEEKKGIDEFWKKLNSVSIMELMDFIYV